ncbi:MAG: 3-oxoacyl-[acyl-carrier-protein] reductase [Nitrospirae bacterium]|nr:3-oxoacyl-[acyl-carrier-protein] reductase [Nitrospirota bacterium]
MNLNEQVAIVTGGKRGIGKAIALLLAQRGANIALFDVQEAEDTVQEIKGLGVKAISLDVDVSSPEDVASAFSNVIKEFGRIDMLINNAGITRDNLIIRMKEEDWDSVISINLKGVFLCSKEAIKVMSKARYGRIVNISSVVAFIGNPGQANYSASKAGIIGLTKTIAKEYASRGITANAVAPGFITTPMTDALSDAVKQEMLKAIPGGRFGSPEEVAHAVGFLVSPEAGYITGQVIHVNGGMFM